ncbi:MAG TPA: hypothetical protein PLD99_01040 [Parcubacteria group bacterium]|nr:hypothetical protein [Parcubacteria group bacterium]
MGNRGTTPSWDDEQITKFGIFGHFSDVGRRLRADMRRSDRQAMFRMMIRKYRGALRCWGYENEPLITANNGEFRVGHLLTFLDRAEELLEMHHDDAAEYLIKFIFGQLLEFKLMTPPYSD